MVSSKNLIKSALLLLLIFPVVLLFAACGDVTKDLETKASCTTTGEWTASTEAEVDEYLGDQTAIESNGYRMTFEWDFGGEFGSMSVNAIITKTQFAVKMFVAKQFINALAGEEVATSDITGYAYYTDGKLYSDATDEQGKQTKEYREMNLEQALDIGMGEASAFTTVESLLEAIDAAPVAYYKDGNNFKMETTQGFNYNGMPVESAVAYLNFNGDKKITAIEMSYTIQGSGTATVIMSAFNGNINFPSFNGYNYIPDNGNDE